MAQSIEPNIADLANGWLKSYKLDEKIFLGTEIWLPDIAEQDNILAIFNNKKNHIRDVKSELNYQQTLLKKLRQQILQEAIEGKLTADWRGGRQTRMSNLPANCSNASLLKKLNW